ncbi:hypothetical protein ABZX12_13800 [Kribbella sp. NPDC003505]|uniref:hypothetical protein n=1 Tax=Kribbella sp. NPDC003505 TaxID=3154448 RepID=UPI0033AADADF
MTEGTSGPLATMAADGKHVVHRLRLVRRVGQALRPHEADLTLLPGENLPLPDGQTEIRTIRTDLILQSLDLRLRIVALPGCTAEALGDSELRMPLGTILMEFPETAALVVVADEELLPSRIFEPADLFDAVGDEQRDPDPQPLPELARTYLRRVSPAWNQPEFVAGVLEDLTAESADAAAEARILVQAKRTTKREAKEARDAIDRTDSIALAATVAAALRGDAVDALIDDVVARRRTP